MSHKHSREEVEQEELGFWASPGAEFGEQVKQLTYTKYLGLEFRHDGNSPYVINKAGLSITDFGGGPVSLLLKTTMNQGDFRAVVDPSRYPQWVRKRYEENGINLYEVMAEDYHGGEKLVDEVWMYNVLQHTESPQKIFDNVYGSLKEGGVFRFLDWIDTPTNVAHPLALSLADVRDLLVASSFDDKDLKQAEINENGAVGKIAYGIFKK